MGIGGKTAINNMFRTILTNRACLTMIVISSITSLDGCSSPIEPYRQIQVCVTDKNRLDELINVIHAVALDNNLTMTDASAQTSAELKDIGAQERLGYDLSRSINIGLSYHGRTKVMITNLGWPNQLLISFFGNPIDDRKLSTTVASDLSKFLRVRDVPPGHGVLPIKSCSGLR